MSFSLLSELEEGSTKAKFQLFEAEMGFEKVGVLIPYDRAEEFATEAAKVRPKGRASLKKLAWRYGGDLA